MSAKVPPHVQLVATKAADVKIVSVQVLLHPNSTYSMIALGSDEKMYSWSYEDGEWKGQWEVTPYKLAAAAKKAKLK